VWRVPLGGTRHVMPVETTEEMLHRLQRRLEDIRIANREVQGWMSMHGSEVPSELLRELAHLDWVIRQAP
jgi:hypothetical protein